MSRVKSHNLQDVRRAGRPAAYPWKVWFDGRTHELIAAEAAEEGEEPDYQGEPSAFRGTVYSAARRYGVRVQTLINEDGNLEVQMVEVEDQKLFKAFSGGLNGVHRK